MPCCSESAAAALRNVNALLLEATAAKRMVRSILAVSCLRKRSVRLQRLPLGSQRALRHSLARENEPRCQGCSIFLGQVDSRTRAANGRHWGPTMRCERSWIDRRLLGAFRFLVSYVPLACLLDRPRQNTAVLDAKPSTAGGGHSRITHSNRGKRVVTLGHS